MTSSPLTAIELDDLEKHLDDETEWETQNDFYDVWSPRLNDRIRRLIATSRVGEDRACPCKYVAPCHDRCTCVTPLSSSGCSRCCTYGSVEQRTARATRLAAAIDPATIAALRASAHAWLDQSRSGDCTDGHLAASYMAELVLRLIGGSAP